ncbi:hypothetical protein BDN72DRAFT_263019 [Pluteus cervinus]|uniref:Uncharacterized protein n=1 Tax=Pluteus cervinus TaxID=181527 RepID=A0ACD3AFT3_9AGAR|nr:hypothetical protein BDN72DRAFT_263019 [Pluteus cervinus]
MRRSLSCPRSPNMVWFTISSNDKFDRRLSWKLLLAKYAESAALRSLHNRRRRTGPNGRSKGPMAMRCLKVALPCRHDQPFASRYPHCDIFIRPLFIRPREAITWVFFTQPSATAEFRSIRTKGKVVITSTNYTKPSHISSSYALINPSLSIFLLSVYSCRLLTWKNERKQLLSATTRTGLLPPPR